MLISVIFVKGLLVLLLINGFYLGYTLTMKI